MTTDLFLDEAEAKKATKLLLQKAGDIGANGHQKLLSDKTSPIYNGAIEQTTGETTIEVMYADTPAIPVWSEYADSYSTDETVPDILIGEKLPNTTERQRRFFDLLAMCVDVAGRLKEPDGKILRATLDMTEYEDDGEGDEYPPVIYEVTATFDSTFARTKKPAKVELKDGDNAVDISELPQAN